MYILVKENTSIYNKLIKDKIYFKNYKKHHKYLQIKINFIGYEICLYLIEYQ